MMPCLRNVNLWRLFLFATVLLFLQCYKSLAPKQINEKSTKPVVTFTSAKRNKDEDRLISYTSFLAKHYKTIDLGPRTVNKTRLSLSWVEKQLRQVLPGGYHVPKDCRSRHKIAIFIPYRDRYYNLVIFLYHMHPFWQNQLLEYQVFVIEQYGHYKFNKGALFNVAFIESQRYGPWGCLIFHDVDLIPLDGRVLYTCPRVPTHMSPAVESNNFQLQYQKLFGGVTAMTPGHFLKVNGYSNSYWSWGGEDDDMYNRLQAARLAMHRLNSSIARFATLLHARQKPNPDRYNKLSKAKKRFRTEGLKSIKYKLISIHEMKLFTHIMADINPFNH